MTIHTFSPDWYEYIVSQKYPLRSLTQISARVWGGGQRPSAPHTQLFLTDITFAPMRDPVLGDIDAFFTRARGRSGAIRIADSGRLAPWSDRYPSGEWPPTTPRNTSTFDDGSTFTDGSGFSSGYLPPEVFVATAAARGSRYIVLGGFPASTSNVLRRNDPFEIKPSGIRAAFPHRYRAMLGGSSDASGLVGIEIEPGLRVDVAAGDTVSLRYASSVFHMVSDDQFDFTGEGAGIGTGGGSLVEALDLIP